MSSRIDLHTELVALMAPGGHVYYQPPENIKLEYPAIVYRLNGIPINHADNSSYHKKKQYELTLMVKDPDSEYIDMLANLPYCRFNRGFVADYLNHYVFTIYY